MLTRVRTRFVTEELLPLSSSFQSSSQEVRGHVWQLGDLSVGVNGLLQQVVAALLLRPVVLCLLETQYH